MMVGKFHGHRHKQLERKLTTDKGYIEQLYMKSEVQNERHIISHLQHIVRIQDKCKNENSSKY